MRDRLSWLDVSDCKISRDRSRKLLDTYSFCSAFTSSSRSKLAGLLPASKASEYEFTRSGKFRELTNILLYRFSKPTYLKRALTRPSAISDGIVQREEGHYKGLKNLGSRVLRSAIIHILFRANPKFIPGQLSDKRDELVSYKILSVVAKKLRLGEFIIMGRSCERNGVRTNLRVSTEILKAIIGALWLDTGCDFKSLQSFILAHWAPSKLLPPIGRSDFYAIICNPNIHLWDKMTQMESLFRTGVSERVIGAVLQDAIRANVDKRIIDFILSKKSSRVALSHISRGELVETKVNPVQLELKRFSAPSKASRNAFATSSQFMELTRILDYTFKNPAFLKRALTRTSAISERIVPREKGDFQSLETVGDALLDLVVASILFRSNPDFDSGQLNNLKSELVKNEGILPRIGGKLRLGEFLIMGRGEELKGMRTDVEALADATEALIGALWLDTGCNYAFLRGFIAFHWAPYDLLAQIRPEEFWEVIGNYRFTVYEKMRAINVFFRTKVSAETIAETLKGAVLICTVHNFPASYNRLLELFLSKKPTISTINKALLIAVLGRNANIARLLLRHGASPNWRERDEIVVVPRRNNEVMVETGSFGTIDSLVLAPKIARGSLVQIEFHIGRTGSVNLHLYGRPTSEITAKEKNARIKLSLKTMLHYACYKDTTPSTELILALIKARVDVNALDDNYHSPLYLLCKNENYIFHNGNRAISGLFKSQSQS